MLIERPLRRRLRLGLTPMIDVVFLLVVFFMLVSTFLEPTSIALEHAATPGSAKADAETIRVHVQASGAIDVDGERVPLATLVHRVQGRLLINPQRPVLVRADPVVPLQRLVAVLDRLESAGASNVILASH